MAKQKYREHLFIGADIKGIKLLNNFSVKNGKGNSRRQWVCLVDNKEIIYSTTELMRIVQQNKIFIPKRINIYKNKDIAALNKVIRNYKDAARYRNIGFNLKNEEVLSLIKGNCFYCGVNPDKKVYFKNFEYSYIGIDRIDSDIGYEKYNCVSCCWKCNYGKKDYKYGEFVEWVKKVYDHLKL